MLRLRALYRVVSRTVNVEEFKVYIISVEDLLIDRLNAFVHWKSGDDGMWAKDLVNLHCDRFDWGYLMREAEINRVDKALSALRKEMDREDQAGRTPEKQV